MGSVLTMQPMPLLLNEVPPSHDRARPRLLRWPEELPGVEVWCCWEDGRREWRPAVARGWTSDAVYVQLSVRFEPLLRWMWAHDVRRAPGPASTAAESSPERSAQPAVPVT